MSPTFALTCEDEVVRRTGLCIQKTGLNNAATCRAQAEKEGCPSGGEPTSEIVPPRQPSAKATAGGTSGSRTSLKARTDDIRKLNAALSAPDKENAAVSKQIIERAFDFALLAEPTDKQDFTTNVQRAWTEILDMREESKAQSQSIPLRNAEYYLMGYYAGLANDPYLSIRTDFGDAYMALKWAAMQSKFTEPWVRSNPQLPATPPGGMEWAKAGLLDGRVLRDTWTSARDAKGRTRSYP